MRILQFLPTGRLPVITLPGYRFNMKKIDLTRFGKNVYSQFGEDGIIEKVFKIVTSTEKEKWCVEFGAWDGIEYSNTRNLIKNKGWRAVLIEPVARRFKELEKNNESNDKIILFNSFVQFDGKDSLDNILSTTIIPIDFDLLSIDIDGNDFHIWKSVKKYKPKIVVIEINPTIPSDIEFVQCKNFNVNQGSSLLSLCKLGTDKGYELIICTEGNAIFVLKKYFHLFGIIDNSPQKMMPGKYLTQFFQLFDGTIVLSGCKRLLWHGIDIDEESIQIIPKYLRHFPNWFTVTVAKILQGDLKTLREIIFKKRRV